MPCGAHLWLLIATLFGRLDPVARLALPPPPMLRNRRFLAVRQEGFCRIRIRGLEQRKHTPSPSRTPNISAPPGSSLCNDENSGPVIFLHTTRMQRPRHDLTHRSAPSHDPLLDSVFMAICHDVHLQRLFSFRLWVSGRFSVQSSYLLPCVVRFGSTGTSVSFVGRWHCEWTGNVPHLSACWERLSNEILLGGKGAHKPCPLHPYIFFI